MHLVQLARFADYPDMRAMSIRRQDGAAVSVASRQSGDLSLLATMYVDAYPDRRKFAAIWGLRESLGWKFREIGQLHNVTEGHACRVYHRVNKAILALAKKFRNELARYNPEADEN